jgi:hypothetical protein
MRHLRAGVVSYGPCGVAMLVKQAYWEAPGSTRKSGCLPIGAPQVVYMVSISLASSITQRPFRLVNKMISAPPQRGPQSNRT